MSFLDLVQSSPSNITSGHRGLFHTVSLQRYSEPLLKQIVNQSNYYGSQVSGESNFFISYDVEPFLNTYGKGRFGSAWPHNTSPLPLNIYFAWFSSNDDSFFRKAAIDSANLLTNQALAEGQELSSFSLYPNYAINSTSATQLYGTDNAAILQKTKVKYDPDNVMGLTTFFDFST